MKKNFVWSWLLALVLTIGLSVLWHVVWFEQAYFQLGVYSRMDQPIYALGLLAWLLEATAFVVIYHHSSYANQGMLGGLKLGFWMAVFVAASVLVGAAAKMHISDLSLWFVLSGSFMLLHFPLMGLALGCLNQPRGHQGVT